MDNYLIKQYDEIRQNIVDAARKAGRDPDEVKLIAVSKTFPNEDIETLYQHGHRLFGENKIQELDLKKPQLPDDIQWHFIGHLQGNKAVKAIECATCIHSIDSLRLLGRVDRLAGDMRRKVQIMLELNLSGEETKYGTDVKTAMEIAEEAVKCENLIFSGLMTMAPWGATEKQLHKVFGGLRELRERMEKEFAIKLPELSMGMSDDYKVAIAEGSTLLRIGTAIFGKRNYL
ncbi:MAG: YggS family pyridoxal phosphate-dependent enzyme [Victivallales bacterium]|nr:YggS family pyridoxal phosphate-dependent enzyme [Victivallales bacterium]